MFHSKLMGFLVLIYAALSITCVAMKLLNFTSVSWVLATAPLWILFLTPFVVYLVIVCFTAILKLLEASNK